MMVLLLLLSLESEFLGGSIDRTARRYGVDQALVCVSGGLNEEGCKRRLPACSLGYFGLVLLYRVERY
jgi:hypothetical protein